MTKLAREPRGIGLGKRRGLAQCSTRRGTIAILALDHRGNLRQALNPADPQSVSFDQMVMFKRQVVRALGTYSTAVLLDPEIGSGPAVAGDDLPGQAGLLLAVEATGYTGDPNARQSQVLPGWSVGKIRRIGASGVKLLIYYHPEAEMARAQENLIEQVAEDCVRYDLPLFLEPLSFSLDPQKKKLPPAELRQVVVETARRLTPLGVDILKAEFPLDIKAEPDEAVWLAACQELDAASLVPWALLSGGVDFEAFLRQVVVACQAGATGVLAGRAVWKEAAELHGVDREEFLRTTATDRMERLLEVCYSLGHPWQADYPPQIPPEGWYQHYADLG